MKQARAEAAWAFCTCTAKLYFALWADLQKSPYSAACIAKLYFASFVDLQNQHTVSGPIYKIGLHLMSQPLCMENVRLNLLAPWSEVRELLKEANFELTDEDLNYEPGREDELLTRLESKLGKSKSQVKAYIESVSSNRGIAG